MLKLRYRRLVPFIIFSLLCACGRGGQTTIPRANSGVTLTAGNARRVQLGAQATTVALPPVDEISGTLVFPAVSSPATVSLSASATAPAGVALDTRRRTQSGTLTVYEYVSMVPATTISLPSIPAMTFTFPATTPLTGKSLFYGISDLDSQGGKISFDTQGPGTNSGQTVNFAQVPTPLTLKAGHSYTFVLYGTTVTHTGATKIYVTYTISDGTTYPTGIVTTYNADGTQSLPTIIDPNYLSFARAIAVDATGKIYVDDYNDVVTYTADGKRTTPDLNIGVPVNGVAVDSKGGIYITGYQVGSPPPGFPASSRLSIFSATGSEVVNVTAGLSNPQGVAVGPNGKIYVTNSPYTTTDTPNITTYTRQGVETTPTITGSLQRPGAIAIDAAGKLYVVDSNTNSIKTFLPDGTPTTPTITSGGATGVAVDAAGKIYVANGPGHNVTTYNSDGTRTTPTIDTGPSIFPSGVAVH